MAYPHGGDVSARGRIESVLVIGAGPSGLAAAHAATGLGYPVRIVSPKMKTEQRGPLLLQRPIPGINTSHPDGYIRQIVIGGGILDYRAKVYGDINIAINGDILETGYHAWAFPETYDRLWEMYSHLITDRAMLPYEMLAESQQKRDQLIVCTAPANRMCMRSRAFSEGAMAHAFASVTVPIIQRAVYSPQPEDTIIFNGDPSVCWTRSSRIFGTEVTEFRDGTTLPEYEGYLREGDNIIHIRKPVYHNCNCFPDVLRTGRFGAWRNQTWVDTAYYDVRNALISDSQADAWGRVLRGTKKIPETTELPELSEPAGGGLL